MAVRDTDCSLVNDLAHTSDDELVRLALVRIDDFAPLYSRYAMVIYRYAFNQVRDPEVANDLTAQVFIRAIERLHQYRPTPGATFRSWLFTIARNIVVDHWRRQRPTRALDRVFGGLRSDAPGPEDIAVHRSQMDDVRRAVDQLPSRYRDIVWLRLAGLTTAEIARALKVTEPALKSAQTRAYKRLRDMLEPTEGESE